LAEERPRLLPAQEAPPGKAECGVPAHVVRNSVVVEEFASDGGGCVALVASE